MLLLILKLIDQISNSETVILCAARVSAECFSMNKLCCIVFYLLWDSVFHYYVLSNNMLGKKLIK